MKNYLQYFYLLSEFYNLFIIVSYKFLIFTFCVLVINVLKENVKNTAKFCLLFDRLFYCINGNFDKFYQTGIKRNSVLHGPSNKSVQIFDSMYFINL